MDYKVSDINWIFFQSPGMTDPGEEIWTNEVRRANTLRRIWRRRRAVLPWWEVSPHAPNFLRDNVQVSVCSYIDLTTSATWAKFRQLGVDQYSRYSCLIETEHFTLIFIIHKTSIVIHCIERRSCHHRTSMSHGQMLITKALSRLIIAPSSAHISSIIK